MAYTYWIGLDTYSPTRVFDLKNLLMSHHKQIIFSKCLIYVHNEFIIIITYSTGQSHTANNECNNLILIK